MHIAIERALKWSSDNCVIISVKKILPFLLKLKDYHHVATI